MSILLSHWNYSCFVMDRLTSACKPIWWFHLSRGELPHTSTAISDLHRAVLSCALYYFPACLKQRVSYGQAAFGWGGVSGISQHKWCIKFSNAGRITFFIVVFLQITAAGKFLALLLFSLYYTQSSLTYLLAVFLPACLYYSRKGILLYQKLSELRVGYIAV